ncbi:MAG: peroxide stress protein YaaA [Mariniphaga sp.]|nr:peroxide stress protein YaaA [Mariniphaga sp.]
MLIVISPSKTLDFEKPITNQSHTQPEFVKEASVLIKPLRKLSVDQLMDLMGISPKLAQLNQERYFLWRPEFTPETARQALYAFRGDVYTGLDADSLLSANIGAAQEQLRILSGLYGVLRPLDLIRPYRLEMGIPLKVGKTNNLYQFWQKKITVKIREDLDISGSNLLINLASVEYFKSVDSKKLKAEIVTPEFREAKEGTYKMVSFFAKKARGRMTRFILQNGIDSEEQLQAFDSDGYCFNRRLSEKGRPVFTRG